MENLKQAGLGWLNNLSGQTGANLQMQSFINEQAYMEYQNEQSERRMKMFMYSLPVIVLIVIAAFVIQNKKNN